jgi:hypothetical protein
MAAWRVAMNNGQIAGFAALIGIIAYPAWVRLFAYMEKRKEERNKKVKLIRD